MNINLLQVPSGNTTYTSDEGTTKAKRTLSPLPQVVESALTGSASSSGDDNLIVETEREFPNVCQLQSIADFLRPINPEVHLKFESKSQITADELKQIQNTIEEISFTQVIAFKVEFVLALILSACSKMRKINLRNLSAIAINEMFFQLQINENNVYALTLRDLSPEAIREILLGLCHRQSKILQLEFHDQSQAALRVLSPVLRDPKSKILYLRIDHLMPDAMAELIESLKHPDCQIFRIYLGEVPPDAITYLLESLRSVQLTRTEKFKITSDYPMSGQLAEQMRIFNHLSSDSPVTEPKAKKSKTKDK